MGAIISTCFCYVDDTHLMFKNFNHLERFAIKYPITISEALDSLYLGIDKQAQAGLNILLVFHAQTE